MIVVRPITWLDYKVWQYGPVSPAIYEIHYISPNLFNVFGVTMGELITAPFIKPKSSDLIVPLGASNNMVNPQCNRLNILAASISILL